MKINTGRWSEREVDDLIRKAAEITDAGERIAYLSHQFLGTEYKESTLGGGPEIQEELVIDLGALDCFTFIDYIEAMRLSGSFAGFAEMLKRVRYRQGAVSFANRNHFLTDWREFNGEFVEDVTKEVGAGHAVRVQKMLNEKEDGTKWVPGIPVLRREIDYVPAPLPEEVIANLRPGDYAGVYSTAAGLDVSHVGIVVSNNGLFLRHASSRLMKVVDEDLIKYFSKKPGIVILRPK